MTATTAAIERTVGIGGTDISAILGLNPWRSPFDVYLEKTGQLGRSPEDNRKLWGKRLQRVIAEAYSEETRRPVEWVDRTMRSSRDFQLWTPDALCTEEARGLDCKTCGLDQADKWGDTGTAEVPDYVALQCAWYMSAGEQEYWDVALLVAGSDFRIFTIQRDMEIEGMILDAGEKFWADHVVAGVAPEITATDTTTEWLKKRFPKNDGAVRLAGEEEIALLDEYRGAYEDYKIAEKLNDDLEVKIKFQIGDSDGLKWSGGKITNKIVRGGERHFTIPDHRRLHRAFTKEK